MPDKKLTDREVCPYCHQDNEGYVKMFGRFYLRKDHFNGWNLYAGKGKPLPIKFCPMCGRILKIEQTQVNSIQDDFCGVPCKFMEEKINRLQAEKENLKDILYDAEGVNLVNYWYQQCKIAENGCKNFAQENKNLKADIKRLEKENKNFLSKLCQKVRTVSKAVEKHIKAEAYKEFAERLKEKGRNSLGNQFVVGWIDNLLKELVGEDNE